MDILYYKLSSRAAVQIAKNFGLNADLAAGGNPGHIVQKVQHDGGASVGRCWIIIRDVQHEAVALLGHLLGVCNLRHPAF